VLRRAALPLYVDEVLQKQLGVKAAWSPDSAAD
jgi:hypothetical protein